MQELTSKNYFESIKNGPVVVEFYADWCGDCRRIAPIMQNMQKEFEGKVSFFGVNFSKEEKLKDTLQIRRIPTLIFYKDGKEVGERLVEPSNPTTIKNAINTIV